MNKKFICFLTVLFFNLVCFHTFASDGNGAANLEINKSSTYVKPVVSSNFSTPITFYDEDSSDDFMDFVEYPDYVLNSF